MSQEAETPNVLLISNEAPHSGSAGGVVLHRLLRTYPAERLLVVTNNPPPDFAATLSCRYERVSLEADRLNRTRFWPWRANLRALGASSLVGLNRIDRKIKEFAPAIILTLMQDSWYFDLAARFAAARGLPLVLLAHDVAHVFEPAHRWMMSRQLEKDARVYRQAAERLCISRGMADYYEKLFGVPGDVLLPPRSDSLPSQCPESCGTLKQGDRLTLGYAGGLHYGYGEQILRMLPVLRSLRIRLEMFCHAPAGALSHLAQATDVLHFNGYSATPEEAWNRLIGKCDVVLQPYLNPPGPHDLQYRTHFPSKLGDCLSLGIPLLVTGPCYASGLAWCLANEGSAITVTDPSPGALAAGLQKLADANLRIEIARKGRLAAKDFDASALRSRLRLALASASSKSRTA